MSTTTSLNFQRVSDLDPAVAEALLQWGLCLADTKHMMGIRISEWINGTPALEAAVGAAGITQDELGHARSLFAELRQFPGAPPAIGAENDLEARDIYFNPRLLDKPWSSWLDVIGANVLLDRALSLVVAATQDSSYAPLRQRAGKILQEEQFHRVYGDSWLARLAAGDGKTRTKLQASLDRFWPTALAWFGPADDPGTKSLYEVGIVTETADTLRQRWLDTVTPLLQKHNLTVPPTELDWSRWDATYRHIAE